MSKLAQPIFALWICACAFTTLRAQNDRSTGFPDTPTQRFIPLPTHGEPSDLSEQAAMLQQLQQMLNLADLLQSSELQNQLNAENQERLSSMFEDFLAQQSQANANENGSESVGNPEAGQDALMRDQARKLLEKFSRDREFPPPSAGGSGSSMLPPGLRNSPSNPNLPSSRRSNQDRPNGVRQGDGQRNQLPQNRAQDNRGSLPGNPGNNPLNPNRDSNSNQSLDRSPPSSNNQNDGGLDTPGSIPPDFNPFDDSPPPDQAGRNDQRPDVGNQASQTRNGTRNGTGNSLRQSDTLGDRLGQDTEQMNELLQQLNEQADRLQNSAPSANSRNSGNPASGRGVEGNRSGQDLGSNRGPTNSPRFNPADLEQLLQDPALQEALRKLNNNSLRPNGDQNARSPGRRAPSSDNLSTKPNNRNRPSNPSLSDNQRSRPQSNSRPPRNSLGNRRSDSFRQPEQRTGPIDSDLTNRPGDNSASGSRNLPDSFDNVRYQTPLQNRADLDTNLEQNPFDRSRFNRSSPAESMAERNQSLGASRGDAELDGRSSNANNSATDSEQLSPENRTWGEWISNLTAGSDKKAMEETAEQANGRSNGNNSQVTANGGSAGSQGESEADGIDVKKTVDRFGLGEALRRIVKDTLEDEGEETESWLGRGSNRSSAAGQATGQSASRTARNSQNSGTPSSSPFNSEQLGKWAQETLRNAGRPGSASGSDQSASNSRSQRARDNQPNNEAGSRLSNNRKSNSSSQSPASNFRRDRTERNASSQNSEDSVGKLASDFWKAISSSPKRQTQSSSSQSAPSLPSSGEGWSVGWQEMLILLAVLVGAAMLWMVYRPLPSEEESQESAAKAVAKQLMATGIRTRSDIVTAFHALVLRRPYSASNWWTHWYVADKVNEITPQRESAIADLTQLYEQARYMPPHAKLSDEQIAKAEAAFRTFAAEG